jgi:hypothetical protein
VKSTRKSELTGGDKVRLKVEKVAWAMKQKAKEFKEQGAEIYKEI